jgi:hypothetical protein
VFFKKKSVEQPKGFEDPHYPHHVYKLKKALYTSLSRLLGHGMSVSPLIFWLKGLQGDKQIENKVLTNSLLKFMLMTSFLELP